MAEKPRTSTEFDPEFEGVPFCASVDTEVQGLHLTQFFICGFGGYQTPTLVSAVMCKTGLSDLRPTTENAAVARWPDAW